MHLQLLLLGVVRGPGCGVFILTLISRGLLLGLLMLLTLLLLLLSVLLSVLLLLSLAMLGMGSLLGLAVHCLLHLHNPALLLGALLSVIRLPRGSVLQLLVKNTEPSQNSSVKNYIHRSTLKCM